jgi:multisubunit Na+/H+ antiporter MnhC subunit
MESLVYLIPITAIVMSVTLAGFIVWLGIRSSVHKRELQSRERMAAIEKGLEIPIMDEPRSSRAHNPLQGALVLMAVGTGLLIFFLSLPVREGNPWGIGVMLMLIGVAMLAHWFIRGRAEWDRDRALDEDLRRAYIERLRAGSAPAATTEAPKAD